MKIFLINLFYLIVLLQIFFAGCSSKDSSNSSEDELDSAVVTADSNTTAIELILKEVTAVETPTTDTTPNYTFSSNEAGTITYGGACGSSSLSAATSGDNTVTLTMPDNSTLDDGTYDNCTIRVTDNSSNTSSPLTVSSFTVGAFKPALAQVTAVPTPTDNITPSYTFFFDSAWADHLQRGL